MRGFRLANPSTTGRCHIGGDVYFTLLDSGAPQVDVGFAVADWKPAIPARHQRAAFPGTAMLVDGSWYEIYRVAPLAGAPHRTAYHLRPWDDAHVIRTAFELTSEACDALTREHRERQQRLARGAALRYVPFLTGLLPAEDQKHLESELGVPANRATMISAVVIMLPSVIVVMATIALALGTHFGEFQDLVKKLALYSPLALYLGLESYARMHSVGGNEPMGSLPVALPVHLFHALRRMNVPREQLAAKRAARPPADGMLAARDQVRALDHPEADLEVLSRLPKDHWTLGVTGIEYQGEAYVLIERSLLETPDGPRHRFLLQKPRHEILFKSYVRYRPEEVRDVYRAQQRAKTATWVETFALFFGLTSGATQERLGRLYSYDPQRWSRSSTVGTAILGLLLAVRGAGRMLEGVADGGDAGVLFGGIFLLWESVLRHSKLLHGEVRGSLFGVLLEPLAKRCLRWE